MSLCRIILVGRFIIARIIHQDGTATKIGASHGQSDGLSTEGCFGTEQFRHLPTGQTEKQVFFRRRSFLIERGIVRLG
jgi:hypothetical protein